MQDINNQILAQVKAARQAREVTTRERELVLAEKPADSAIFLSRPREVYKETNIKILNDISRSSEESQRTCPSDPLGERTSFSEVSPEGKGEEVKRDEGLMMSPPATTSSRIFSGISAQHNITARGIKVSITLQKADEADDCAYLELTAELKRSDRIRELKPYAHDNDDFAEFYHGIKQHIKHNMNTDERRQICLGRLHARGSRAEWVADMMVIGQLDSNNILEQVKFYYDDEYVIDMNQTLTRRQTDIYHSSGLYGTIKRQRTAPTLETLKRKYF